MTIVRSIMALMLLAVVAGCSGNSVTADFDPEADFTVYKTWDWLPEVPSETGDRRLDSSEVRARIRGAIAEELVARGFPLSTDAPTFQVIYHAALDQDINVRNIEHYYQYMDYVVFVPWVTSSYTEVLDVGTLIIDIFDPGTHTLVWRGMSRTKFNAQAGPRENEPIIRKAVKGMLEQFPPKRR